MDLQEVCRTCLASDRRLHPPGQYQSMLNVLVSTSWTYSSLPIGICFECRAILHKASNFTMRAMQAEMQLRQLWDQKQKSVEDLILNCLTTLDVYSETYTVSTQSDENFSQQLLGTNSDEVTNTAKCIKMNAQLPETNTVDNMKFEPRSDNEDDDLPLIKHKKKKEKKKRKKSKSDDQQEQDSFGNVENCVDDEECSQNKILCRSKASKKGKKRQAPPEFPPDSERFRIVEVSEMEQALWRARDAASQRYATKTLPFKCETCLMSFRWSEQLEKHNRSKHDPSVGQFTCQVCACRFGDEAALESHAVSHRSQYECLNCGRVERTKRDIDRHYEMEHSTPRYKCNVCGKMFKTFFQQRYHREAAHRPMWKCQHCDKTFRLRGGLYSHMRIHQELPKAECPICGKVYKNKYAQMYHLRVHEEAKSPHYCRACDVHFKTGHQLRLHNTTSMKHVTPDKLKFSCDVCGRRFITEKRRNHHHDSVHLNKTEFACSECSKSYANKQSLRSHVQRKHRQADLPRDKICDICGKGFHNNVLLRNHMRTHTGERPFHCKLCPATFSYSAALYTHNRLIHLKLKRDRKKKPTTECVDKEWEAHAYQYQIIDGCVIEHNIPHATQRNDEMQEMLPT